MERIYSLCCEGIGTAMKPITFFNAKMGHAKKKGMIKVHNKCMESFYKNWKGLEKLSTENFCRAILSGQNDGLLYEVGYLCLRVQETFELESL